MFNIESADQSEWSSGSYTYQKYVTKTGESTVLIKTGKVKIEPFFADDDLATLDGRSYAQRMLDAIEARIEDRTANIEISYAYKGKQIVDMQYDELLKARTYFQNEVNLEEMQAALDAGEQTTGRLFFGFD